MAAPKKNPHVRELEQALKNFIGSDEPIPLILNDPDRGSYASAASVHRARIDENSYAFDSLVLAPIYEGLATGDVDSFVEAAAAAVAIATQIEPPAETGDPVEPTTKPVEESTTTTEPVEEEEADLAEAPGFEDDAK